MTTTATSTTTDRLEAIKARQRATWASGDYSAVATLIVPVAERLVDFADLLAGSDVLDVATGSGNAALAAARLQARVVGVDYVAELLERGRRRAAPEGLAIDFREGDAERLPFADASFDAVISVFGSMFAPDHEQTAREMLRVTRPGGTIGLASWTPDRLSRRPVPDRRRVRTAACGRVTHALGNRRAPRIDLRAAVSSGFMPRRGSPSASRPPTPSSTTSQRTTGRRSKRLQPPATAPMSSGRSSRRSCGTRTDSTPAAPSQSRRPTCSPEAPSSSDERTAQGGRCGEYLAPAALQAVALAALSSGLLAPAQLSERFRRPAGERPVTRIQGLRTGSLYS